jgi:hypothetical protein
MMFIYSETSFGARFNLWPEKPANFRLWIFTNIEKRQQNAYKS